MEGVSNTSEAVLQLLEMNGHSTPAQRIAAAFVALLCMGVIVAMLVAISTLIVTV